MSNVPRVATQDFSLEGFAELAAKAGVNLEESPESAKADQAAAAEKQAQDALEGKPPVDGEQKPEIDESSVVADETQEQIAEREAAEAEEDRKAKEAEGETAEAKAEREKKEAEEAAKPKEDKKDGENPDADLDKKVSESVDVHTKPKTRQLAEFLKNEAKTARAAQRALAAEKAKLEKDLADLKAQATTPAPKELTEEVTKLRERLQEVDAAQDPGIVQKYDQPIARNRKAILDILKQPGFDADKFEDGSPNPHWEAELTQAGLSLRTLKPYIEELEKQGFPDEAEQIREAVRENARLTRDRGEEIGQIKGKITERIAARTTAQQQEAVKRDTAVMEHANVVLARDLESLNKSWSQLQPPASPDANDTSVVANAKRAAIAEWEKGSQAIASAVKSFRAEGNDPVAATTAHGRVIANAIQNVIVQTRLLPKLQAQIATLAKENADLKAKNDRVRSAGAVSRAHSAAVGEGGKSAEAKSDPNLSTADDFTKFARSQGVPV